ncbi:MAG: glycosyltransferase [Acidobacteria bacterium]|nr:glycosyltransferase [Acidobacteriota bacterium]
MIIPAYNAQTYIAETLGSVLAQTYKNYEVIVVDDGSSDGTLRIAKSFEPRIKVLTKQNGGPASARNLAINSSLGDYLAFLDSDDLWVEDKLERQTAFLDENPGVRLVYSEALMFTENNGEKKVGGKIGYTTDPSFRLLLFGDYIPNSTVMIRRACVEKIGLLNESRELVGVEDYEYWMRIAKHFRMAGIPRPLAYYRIRAGNLMGDGSDINKGLKLSLAAIREIDRLYPDLWEEYQVDRETLLARLHIRAGFAWKKRHNWKQCVIKLREAVGYSSSPRVFRWMVAAMLLKRWS